MMCSFSSVIFIMLVTHLRFFSRFRRRRRRIMIGQEQTLPLIANGVCGVLFIHFSNSLNSMKHKRYKTCSQSHKIYMFGMCIHSVWSYCYEIDTKIVLRWILKVQLYYYDVKVFNCAKITLLLVYKSKDMFLYKSIWNKLNIHISESWVLHHGWAGFGRVMFFVV